MRETIQMLQNMTETQKTNFFEDAQVKQNSDDDEFFEEADDNFIHVIGWEGAASVPDNELVNRGFGTRMVYLYYILRVSDQNSVCLLCIMLEIHHSGWEPSISCLRYTILVGNSWNEISIFDSDFETDPAHWTGVKLLGDRPKLDLDADSNDATVMYDAHPSQAADDDPLFDVDSDFDDENEGAWVGEMT